MLLLTPMFIAACFEICWISEDTNETRARLYVACILTVISLLLLAFWNCFYIVYLYKYPDVLTEVGERVTKKSFVVWSLYLGTVLAFIWAYFLCISNSYYIALMDYDQRKAYDEEQKNKKSGFSFGSLPGMPKEEEPAKAEEPAMSPKASPKKEDAPADAPAE